MIARLRLLRQRVVDVVLRSHRPDLAALFRSERPPRAAAKVRAVQQALVPLARQALGRYLMERGLPVSPTLWRPETPLLASLEDEGGITTSRLGGS